MTILISFLSFLTQKLPYKFTLFLGSIFAQILYFIYRLTPYRNLIFSHIQTALDLPPKKIHSLARTHVFNLVYSIIDLLRLPLLKDNPELLNNVHIKGWHHFWESYQKNQGVILLSAHYGFWEMIPAFIGLSNIPTHVLVQRPSVAAIDQLFTKNRESVGVETKYNTSLEGLRPLLRALKNGEVIGLVIDQHGESNRLIGEFFSHQVSLPEGPLFFGALSGSPLVPVLAKRINHEHHLTFYPPLYIDRSIWGEEELMVAKMQEIYTWLEKEIKAHPQDWLWSYNRFDKLVDQADKG